MRVLYVEDNEVNQALVARVMRARQNKVLFCEEGEKALEILADDSDIELVLLDIELAGVMSGLDVIRTLRARNDRRPVVAITAYAMMGDRERILEAGCDQYLPKPLVIPDLLKILDHYEDVIAASAAAPATPAPAPVVDTAAASTETPKEPATSAPTTEPAPADKAAPAVPAVAATPAQDAAPPKPLTPAAESVPAEQPEVAAVTAVPADQPPSAAAVPAPSSPDSPPQPVKDMSPVATPPVDSALVEPVEEKQHEQG